MSTDRAQTSIRRPRTDGCTGTRREFLWEMGAGFAGLALVDLLSGDGFFTGPAAAAVPASPYAARPAHFRRPAKHVIFIFCYGGPPSMDTFDYKPELQKRDGQTVDIEIRRGSIQKQKLLASRRTFRQHGKSGLWCSDAFPMLAQHMDDICVIKSMYADTFAHGSAMIQLNTGRIIQGSPSVGSWMNYGLGTLNQNLPGYVVMLDPRGGPISGAANWSAGFMPAAYQGTHLRNKGEPILDLAPKDGSSAANQRDQVETINRLNAAHLRDRPGYSELQARMATYELAFQLQSTAPEVMDLSREPVRVQEMYGLDRPKPDSHKLAYGPSYFGRQCLIARRLVERGVRFIQIYSGGGHQQENWDAHHGVEENLLIHGPEIDRPLWALMKDLKERGLLEETLIVWGGEFGRQPVSQGENGGRDHNPKGFCYWLAGGGVKGGTAHGETDELGHEAAVDRVHVRDLHATILHLMGLDHHRLGYFYGGLNHRLTGPQEAHVVERIVA